MTDSPLWRQFRRLLLGAVVEALLDAGIAVSFPTLRIAFEDDSVFHVPRLDNYMRFVGSVTAVVSGPVSAADLAGLRARLGTLWLELLGAIELPVGDALTNEHARVEASIEASTLRLRFDFAAD